MIGSFLKAAEKSDLKVLKAAELERAERRGDLQEPLLFYEDETSRIALYESGSTLNELLHPFREAHEYLIDIDAEYLDGKSYFAASEDDVQTITGKLSRKVETADDAYMKILRDLET